MEQLDNPDREIDSRSNDGMITTWFLRPDGSHYVTVEDHKLETYDVLEPPSPEVAINYYEHPQKYIGATVLENVVLGEN